MGSSISLAMIVKDEGEMLPECLECVKDLVEEICVIDTGSRDDTREIARDYGARIRSFLWCEDFAAARNESLLLCTKDWVLVLDADERIAAEDLPKLAALVKGPDNRCFRFVTRNYTDTTAVSEFHQCSPDDPNARGFAGWYPSTKVRLFPARAGAQYEGKVHELVRSSLERKGIQVVDCEVPIHHYPQLKGADRIRQKQEQYLRLGHEKVAEDPSNPRHFIELGNQYAEVKNYPQAAAAYREALKLDSSNPSVLKDLGGVLHLMGRDQESERFLRMAVEFDPSLVDGWRNLGVLYADTRNWPQAIDCFRRAASLESSWSEGHRFLSVALEGGGYFEEAALESRKALEAMPHDLECLKLFVHQMLRLGRRGDARDVLEGILDKGNSEPNLHNALGELYFYDDELEAAKSNFAKAGQFGRASGFNNLGVVLIKERRYPEAKEAFEKCLAMEPGHNGALANLAKVQKLESS